MNLGNIFSKIDRRWIFALVWLTVLFPLVVPIEFPISISPEARKLYDAVEALPDSSRVILTFDVYPDALAETEPMARAALHHMLRKNFKIVTLTTIPLGGPSIAERVTREMAQEYGKQYGIDFVNLGYKPNYVSVLRGLGESIESIYPTDNRGTPLGQLPLMSEVKSYKDLKFIFVVTDNGIIDYWISIVHEQFNMPVGAGVTSVMAPKQFAYLGAGQLTGLLGGMKGAAEYEQLVEKPGLAITGMGIQSLVHFLIIALIAIGNLGYFMTKRKAAQSTARAAD